MKRSFLFICIGLLAATTASAQNPPAQSGPNNNAVNSAGQNNSKLPSRVATASPKDKPSRKSRMPATPTSLN